MKWSQMGKGARIFTVAAAIAVLSMLLPWVDIGIVSRNGLEQQAYIFLLPWLYPALRILKNEKQKKVLSAFLLFISFIGTVLYILSKGASLFGEAQNFSGSGSHLFAVSCLVALSGVSQYNPWQFKRKAVLPLEEL